jgi:AraC-like DNA-binding protein
MEPRFEAVAADAASSFCSKWFTCGSFSEDHTWHYHPEFELSWVVRGHGTRFTGDNIEPYRAGDLVLIGPNLPHCWHDEDTRDCGQREAVVVQFRPETFGHDFLDLPEFQPIKRLFRASKCGLSIEGATAERVRALMRSLFEKRGIARLIGLLDILRELAETDSDTRCLASADYHITNDITEANRQRIELIHRYVRENLASQINQAKVARLVGLTPPAFSRFFRRATGRTFVGFVNILRINEVCRIMTESNEGITSIAMNCGYNNIANFNRQFLALKGMNPSQHRQRHLRLQRKAELFSAKSAGTRRVLEHQPL